MRAPLLRSLLAALLLAGGTAPGFAEEGGELLPRYTIRAAPWGSLACRGSSEDELAAEEAEITRSLALVEDRLGRKRGNPFTAVLAQGQAEFTRIFRSLAGQRPERWVAGAAFPGQNLLAVKLDGSPLLKPFSERPRAVLEHELAHLVIHRRGTGGLPGWFDEGLSMWAARQLPEPEELTFLSGLARIGGLHPLAALEAEMPRSHDLAAIAYQESGLLLEWMTRRWGPRAPARLLASVEGGGSFKSALEAESGLSPQEFERQFLSWLSGRRSLLEVVIYSVNLWTLTSLLALLAIGRSVLRRRRLLCKMEEAEREEEALER
jgi:hypothetical protein